MSETIWNNARWRSEPRAYTVVSRKAKTLRAVAVESPHDYSTYEHRVLTSQIGVDWFWSEREAWEALALERAGNIERAKADLQRERSALGQIEAKLKTLDRAQPAVPVGDDE